MGLDQELVPPAGQGLPHGNPPLVWFVALAVMADYRHNNAIFLSVQEAQCHCGQNRERSAVSGGRSVKKPAYLPGEMATEGAVGHVAPTGPQHPERTCRIRGHAV